jgi:hypothetical protein
MTWPRSIVAIESNKATPRSRVSLLNRSTDGASSAASVKYELTLT